MAMLSGHLGLKEVVARPVPDVDRLPLPAPRVRPPEALAGLCGETNRERAAHAHGRSFRDVVRNLRGQIEHPPDLVVYPRSEADVAAVLEWCGDANIAVIPFGGGSSVVAGVEPDVGDGYAGAVSLDLGSLASVSEVDARSRAARIGAGIRGPALEDALRPHGLTLRHFPQSFEHSTLGGWLATRSGGHYATLHTHIDDFVESIRMVCPAGIMETRRLPSSGAGPSPERLLLGSEGILGVITAAWMRLQPRPRFRARATLRFDDFDTAAEAARAVVQSGLNPSNCRLLDPLEALLSGAVAGGAALLIVAFESADHPLDAWIARAVELGADHGGTCPEGIHLSAGGEQPGHDGAAGAWRRAFLRGPYLRDALARCGLVLETFETAVTWDRFAGFHAAVMEATRHSLEQLDMRALVSCRFTHLYPDGPAPYYTVIAAGDPDAQLEQWDQVKAAASEAVIAGGGTITHHHAVGRDHRPWYDRERPDAFAAALKAAKQALDPAGVLNPGVLLDVR
ncbi:MAG: FAD-binding oxidoreductase [Chloroflexi bacterium]|nr:MAG: FAD-binding oxidoreductase [Chloroflexota bacterium]